MKDLLPHLAAYVRRMAPHQAERQGGKLLIWALDELQRLRVTLHQVECGLRAAEEDRGELVALMSALVDRCAYDGVPSDSLQVWQTAHDAVMSRKTPPIGTEAPSEVNCSGLTYGPVADSDAQRSS